MTAEPVGAGQCLAVRESGGISGLYSGGVESPPVCVQADSKSPVQLCAKANLQKMLKACVCRAAGEPWDVARPTYAGGSV